MTTVKESLLIKTTPDEAYRTWRDRPALFMADVQTVEAVGGQRQRWSLETAQGDRLQWTTVQTMDEAPTRLAWSGDGGDLQQSGQVTFHAVSDDLIEVSLMATTAAGEGKDGSLALLGDLRARWRTDLSRFKALLEGRLENE